MYRGETDVPKSERSRRVLPLGHLDGALRRHCPLNSKLDDYVFEKGGVPLGWHSFRRQNPPLIQEEGATAIEAQAQAGHSRPVMTSEYAVVGLDRREMAVRRAQQRLFGGLLDEEARPLPMRA